MGRRVFLLLSGVFLCGFYGVFCHAGPISFFFFCCRCTVGGFVPASLCDITDMQMGSLGFLNNWVDAGTCTCTGVGVCFVRVFPVSSGRTALEQQRIFGVFCIRATACNCNEYGPSQQSTNRFDNGDLVLGRDGELDTSLVGCRGCCYGIEVERLSVGLRMAPATSSFLTKQLSFAFVFAFSTLFNFRARSGQSEKAKKKSWKFFPFTFLESHCKKMSETRRFFLFSIVVWKILKI